MTKSNAIKILFTTLALFTLSACGGGGGGGGGFFPPPQQSQPTTAAVKISTQGTLPAGSQIGGIIVTLHLPAGVSVNATADSSNPAVLVTDAGVVTASGVAAGANATVLATYAAGPPAAVSIKVANPNGFGTGEFTTVNCTIASGSFPTAADFSLSDFSAVDLNGAAISGLTAGFTADIN